MSEKPIHEGLDGQHQLKVYGYEILRLGVLDDFIAFKTLFSDYLFDALGDANHAHGKKRDDFQIEFFHEHLESMKLDHHEFIGRCGRVLPEEFSSHAFIKSVLDASSQSVGKELKLFMDKIEFRVVRPHHSDNNPFHRDHWFPYFIPLLNIYAPLSGNYYDSAMPIIPRSHLWSDEDVKPTFTYEDIKAGRKSVKNGVAYSVPEVAYCKHPMTPHRPDVLLGDAMCFSPLMVHGAGTNTSAHTRFSLEFRLEQI